MKSNSWIIRNKETKEVIMETFNPNAVAALNTLKYEAIDAHTYLCELSASIRAKDKEAAA